VKCVQLRSKGFFRDRQYTVGVKSLLAEGKMLTKNDLAGRLLQLATDTNVVEAETIVRSDQLVSVLNIVQYSFSRSTVHRKCDNISCQVSFRKFLLLVGRQNSWSKNNMTYAWWRASTAWPAAVSPKPNYFRYVGSPGEDLLLYRNLSLVWRYTDGNDNVFHTAAGNATAPSVPSTSFIQPSTEAAAAPSGTSLLSCVYA